MADRIFPNTYQEEPLDSDLVFKGIDWDNFNERLAEAKDPKENKGLKKLIDSLGDDYVDELQGQKHAEDDTDESMKDMSEMEKTAKKGLPAGLAKWMEEHGKGKKKDSKADKMAESEDGDSDEDSDECPECNCDPCECDGKTKKKASTIVFNHPSQLSAEAVEAAIAAGDDRLKNAILAARHERRVRLASKIEAQIEAENEVATKLAQRKAYRESLVNKFVEASKTKTQTKVAKTDSEENKEFVKISDAHSQARQAFASKALAQGFPKEYVDAMLGNKETASDNTKEIRDVMSSDLNMNVKVSAVQSMVKTATLSDADYDRLIDYWVNELGYQDKEWVEKLFTKEYD